MALPVGLAILAWKLAEWRRFQGGELVASARAKFAGLAGGFGAAALRGGGWPIGRRSSGNTVFDAWRAAELARFDEQRRKLEATHREFAQFLRNLRHAKDREEFDRFMNAFMAAQRHSASSAPSSGEDKSG